MNTKDKLAALRAAMEQEHIDAYIVFSADPHMSEYLPEQWLERQWLTGFTGSAGFVVVTQKAAALWTDGRYFVQAAHELEGSSIEMMKDGLPETPNYKEWLRTQLPDGGTVALNPVATAHTAYQDLQQYFDGSNISIVGKSLLSEVWTERPGVDNTQQINPQKVEFAGETCTEKIAKIREKMASKSCDALVLNALDDIAWTLNLRGSDVAYNPVFLAYLMIEDGGTTVFLHQEKLSAEAKAALADHHVAVQSYDQFFDHLKKINQKTIWLPGSMNQRVYETLAAHNKTVIEPSPVALLKAVKNDAELKGLRQAMMRDGVAMVKFLYWLTHHAAEEGATEFTAGQKLKEIRAEGENFVGESFGSIIGYQGNGAIVHYSAKREEAKKLENVGSILVDSGGQYKDGTTDITRTLPLGPVSQEFITDATLVLQGMIRLSMAKFPAGTRGVQLDTIARLPLWLQGKDYAHGTGHGVGHFLNVHEGPQNIRKDLNPQELLPGMILSDEPGFYVVNQYGIRHENLVAVRKSALSGSAGADFYEFETLTVCPFFTSIIDTKILSDAEIEWLNNYHQWCKDLLGGHLDEPERSWLETLTAPITK